YAVTRPVLRGSSSHAPVRSNTSRQAPAGGMLPTPAPKRGVDFAWSFCVTVLVQVPASAAGGRGAGWTRAVTTSVTDLPSAFTTCDANTCWPALSQVVIR